jgi:hypothetical protein
MPSWTHGQEAAGRALRALVRLFGNVAVCAALCLAPVLVAVGELTDHSVAAPRAIHAAASDAAVAPLNSPSNR